MTVISKISKHSHLNKFNKEMKNKFNRNLRLKLRLKSSKSQKYNKQQKYNRKSNEFDIVFKFSDRKIEVLLIVK